MDENITNENELETEEGQLNTAEQQELIPGLPTTTPVEQEVEVEPKQENKPEPAEPKEKTFTQAELDAIVAKRVARAQKNMPPEDELKAFREWREAQKTEREKITELEKSTRSLTRKLEASQLDNETLKKELFLVGKGVPLDDVDFYVYKINKLVDEDSEFEDVAKEYLEKRKINNQPNVRVNMTAPLSGSNGAPKSASEIMNDILRKKVSG